MAKGLSCSHLPDQRHAYDVIRQEEVDADQPPDSDLFSVSHDGLQRLHWSSGDKPSGPYPTFHIPQRLPHTPTKEPSHAEIRGMSDESSDASSEKPVPEPPPLRISIRSHGSNQPADPIHDGTWEAHRESFVNVHDPLVRADRFPNGLGLDWVVQPPQIHFEISADDESSVVSGVSSPGRAARQSMRSFPPAQPNSELPPSYTSRPQGPNAAGYLPSNGYQYENSYENHLNWNWHGNGHPNESHFSLPRPDYASHMSAQWSDLYDQRRRATQGRKTMMKLINELKALRIQKSKAEEDFRRMTLLYSEASQPLPHKRSSRLLEKMKTLQDDIVSVESRLEELGEDMERREARLESSEIAFYNSPHSGSFSAMDMKPQPPSMPAIQQVAFERHNSHQVQTRRALRMSTHSLTDYFLLGISDKRPSDEHPLFKLLTQTTLDLEAARKRYAELAHQCENIKDNLRSRFEHRSERSDEESAFNFTELDIALAEELADDYHLDLSQSAYLDYLDKVDTDFLLRYEDTIASTSAIIRTQEQHVTRLRETCRQMAVLPDRMFQDDDDDSSDEDYKLPGQGRLEDIDSLKASDVSSFPILLSNPLFIVKHYPLTPRAVVQKMLALPENAPQRQALVDDSVKEYGIISSLMRSAQGNKFDFINRWILQQLRMSPLAALHLFTVFSGMLRIMNHKRWQEDVLYFWARDGTNLPDYYYRNPISVIDWESSSKDSSSAHLPDTRADDSMQRRGFMEQVAA